MLIKGVKVDSKDFPIAIKDGKRKLGCQLTSYFGKNRDQKINGHKLRYQTILMIDRITCNNKEQDL